MNFLGTTDDQPLAFRVNDNLAMTVVDDPTGPRVGIGTEAPISALQVAGTATATTFQGSGIGLTGIPWASLSSVPAGFNDGVDNDSGGDITGVTAGTGLTGGASSGNATLGAAFAGTGAASTVARSDHGHTDLAPLSHNHDASYYTRSLANSTFLNSSGPDTMTARTSGAALTVSNAGGVAINATTASTLAGGAAIVGQAAGTSGLNTASVSGLRGDSNDGIGVVGTSSSNAGVQGFSASGTGVEGRSITGNGVEAYSVVGNALYASGTVHVAGTLEVTGSYRGDLGPNNGAPFARPAYDSGWKSISTGGSMTIPHNLGGDVSNYVVILQGRGPGTNQWPTITDEGIHFFVNNQALTIVHEIGDTFVQEVRIRIWFFN